MIHDCARGEVVLRRDRIGLWRYITKTVERSRPRGRLAGHRSSTMAQASSSSSNEIEGIAIHRHGHERVESKVDRVFRRRLTGARSRGPASGELAPGALRAIRPTAAGRRVAQLVALIRTASRRGPSAVRSARDQLEAVLAVQMGGRSELAEGISDEGRVAVGSRGPDKLAEKPTAEALPAQLDRRHRAPRPCVALLVRARCPHAAVALDDPHSFDAPGHPRRAAVATVAQTIGRTLDPAVRPARRRLRAEHDRPSRRRWSSRRIVGLDAHATRPGRGTECGPQLSWRTARRSAAAQPRERPVRSRSASSPRSLATMPR